MTPYRVFCEDKQNRVHIIQGMVCNDKYLIERYKTPYCMFVTEKVIEYSDPNAEQIEKIAHKKTSRTNSKVLAYAIIKYDKQSNKYVAGSDIQGITLESVMRKYTNKYIEQSGMRYLYTL